LDEQINLGNISLCFKTDRILATNEEKSKEIKKELTKSGDEKNEEINSEIKEKNHLGSKESKVTSLLCDSNIYELTQKYICAPWKRGFRTADSFFEKKILDVLKSGSKNIKDSINSNGNLLNNVKFLQNYALFFSQVIINLVSNKLFLSGHYNASYLLSTICTIFYFYSLLKLQNNIMDKTPRFERCNNEKRCRKYEREQIV
ncbi:hypothetical protein PMALA_069960, partial [Plasmodium malariae]